MFQNTVDISNRVSSSYKWEVVVNPISNNFIMGWREQWFTIIDLSLDS